MDIRRIEEPFSVCKAADYSRVDWTQPYLFIGKTAEENSLVCPTKAVPANVTAREDGWRAFCVAGTLDFSLVGILARISGLLAERGIPLFAVSTYDTDYVLVKAGHYETALSALAEAGYHVI